MLGRIPNAAGMVAHAYNSSTWDVEAEYQEFKIISGYTVSSNSACARWYFVSKTKVKRNKEMTGIMKKAVILNRVVRMSVAQKLNWRQRIEGREGVVFCGRKEFAIVGATVLRLEHG